MRSHDAPDFTPGRTNTRASFRRLGGHVPFTFPPRMVAATRGVSGTLRKKQERGQGSCALTLPRPRHLRARAPLAHRSSRQSDEDVARPGPKSRRSDLRLAACPTPGDDLGDQRRRGGAMLAAGRLRAGAGSADLLKRDILNMIVSNVHREEDTAGDEAAQALWRGRVCKRQRRGGEGQGPRLLPRDESAQPRGTGHAWPQHCQVARVRCARSSGCAGLGSSA